MLRSGNRPLAQVCRRLRERFDTVFKQPNLPPNLTILKASRPDPNEAQIIAKLKYQGLIISKKLPNNGILLRNGTILQLENIYKTRDENIIKIQGKVLIIEKLIYTYPCDSSTFKIWRVRKMQTTKTCSIKLINRKMMILDLSDEAAEKRYALSLIHM